MDRVTVLNVRKKKHTRTTANFVLFVKPSIGRFWGKNMNKIIMLLPSILSSSKYSSIIQIAQGTFWARTWFLYVFSKPQKTLFLCDIEVPSIPLAKLICYYLQQFWKKVLRLCLNRSHLSVYLFILFCITWHCKSLI